MESIGVIADVGTLEVKYSVTDFQENEESDYQIFYNGKCIGEFEVETQIGDQISTMIAEDVIERLEGNELYHYVQDVEVLGFIVPRMLLHIFLMRYEDLEVYPA